MVGGGFIASRRQQRGDVKGVGAVGVGCESHGGTVELNGSHCNQHAAGMWCGRGAAIHAAGRATTQVVGLLGSSRQRPPASRPSQRSSTAAWCSRAGGDGNCRLKVQLSRATQRCSSSLNLRQLSALCHWSITSNAARMMVARMLLACGMGRRSRQHCATPGEQRRAGRRRSATRCRNPVRCPASNPRPTSGPDRLSR